MADIDRKRIIETANEILAGNLDVVSGCRILKSALHDKEFFGDPDANCIIGVDSETDDLPMGAVRDLWNSDALAKRDAAREEYVARVRERVFKACRNLIAKVSQ